MPIAQVVPLRRLPTDRLWFDYNLPAEGDWQPGQLVEIPFLRSRVRGILWRLVDQTTVPRIKTVIRALRTDPVISDWQRQVVESVHRQSFASFGHILDGLVPVYSSRQTPDSPVETLSQSKPARAAWPPGTTWWYRSRPEAETWLVSWVSHQSSPAVVITPTIEDAERLAGLCAQQGSAVQLIHSQLGRAAYREAYEAIRLGRITRVIGTARALLLPYPESPRVIIDQEEHPGHKNTLQHPRFDIRPIVAELGVLSAVTTPSPSLWWWRRAKPAPPPPAPSQRQLISLDQPGADIWLTPELITLLDQATTEKKQVAMVVPRRGYAGSVRCRHCGLSLTCPVCHHAASLHGRLPGPLKCQYCGQRSNVPTQCPRCQGIDWQLTGLGPERLADLLGQRWPGVPLIGTYQLYRSLLDRSVAGLVVVHGDALLNIPDFSAEERAWQYLARLQSVQPTSPLMVQTFRPQDDFWQRWRRSDDQAWYASEQGQRQRLHLPPFSEEWIVRLPKADPAELKRKQRWLKAAHGQNISARLLPGSQSPTRSGPRLLLSSSQGSLAQVLDGARDFPTPWQVETVVTSWLD